MRDDKMGVFIVCNDRALLDNVNRMLRGSGILGIKDKTGVMHYLIDAREDQADAVINVNRILTGGAMAKKYEDAPLIGNVAIRNAVAQVMKKYGFDEALMGTQALEYIIRSRIKGELFIGLGAKIMFQYAAEHMNITYAQVERNIRYAVRRSDLGSDGIKSANLVHKLSDEAVAILRSRNAVS